MIISKPTGSRSKLLLSVLIHKKDLDSLLGFGFFQKIYMNFKCKINDSINRVPGPHNVSFLKLLTAPITALTVTLIDYCIVV